MKTIDDSFSPSGDSSVIYLAGGCFWGMEALFSQAKGVIDVTCGYANGDGSIPDYERVCHGNTHYKETIRVIFNPNIVTLIELVRLLLDVIDVTAVNRQGGDVGEQYQSAVFYTDDAQKNVLLPLFKAEAVAQRDFAVLLERLVNFFTAEQYHQHYLAKNPNGYCHISLDKRKSALAKLALGGYKNE